MAITAIRYHDFSMGHTVTGHESKCAMIHGHNYRVYFHVDAPELDEIGRVMDFSVIKDLLCEWLEEHWDHRFLVSVDDPRAIALKAIDNAGTVIVDFNPTSENILNYVSTLIIKALNSLNPEFKLEKMVLWETSSSYCEKIFD